MLRSCCWASRMFSAWNVGFVWSCKTLSRATLELWRICHAIVLLVVSPDQVFGCSLSSLCQRENSTVPTFVRMCIDHVESSGASFPSWLLPHFHFLLTSPASVRGRCSPLSLTRMSLSILPLQVCALTACTGWAETWPSYRSCASPSTTVRNPQILALPAWCLLAALWLVLLVSDTDEKVNLQDGKWEDIHVTTGALKMYFRELPEPLFTYALFHDFVSAISRFCQASWPAKPTYHPTDSFCLLQRIQTPSNESSPPRSWSGSCPNPTTTPCRLSSSTCASKNWKCFRCFVLLQSSSSIFGAYYLKQVTPKVPTTRYLHRAT